MAKESKNIKMEIFIKVNSMKDLSRVMGSICITMVLNIVVNLKVVRYQDKVKCSGKMEIIIKVHLSIILLMVMENIIQNKKMLHIRDSIKMVKDMERAIFLEMVYRYKEYGIMVDLFMIVLIINEFQICNRNDIL